MSVGSVPHILFIFDAHAGRERRSTLSQIVYALRGMAKTTILAGDATEDQALSKLQSHRFDLVLYPFRYYGKWNRIEAQIGINSTSGPTAASYFVEPIANYPLPAQPHSLRCICIDLARIAPSEAAILIRALASEKDRSGLAPLLRTGTPIFFETWTQTRESGAHYDLLFGLPEWNESEWCRHNPSIRAALAYLWSLAFDQGPAKSEMLNSAGLRIPRAWFQFGFQPNLAAARMIVPLPRFTAKQVIHSFWDNTHGNDTDRAIIQGLRSNTDFLRVHAIPETHELELTLGWFQSRPSLAFPDEGHTLWLEPLSQKLFSEPPYLTPIDDSRLKPLNNEAGAKHTPIPSHQLEELKNHVKSLERAVLDLYGKLNQTRRLAADQEQMIKELRRGGVGQAHRFKPPDAPALVDALESQLKQIQTLMGSWLQRQQAVDANRDSPFEAEVLRKKIRAQMESNEDLLQGLQYLVNLLQEIQEKAKKSSTSPSEAA